MDKSVVFGMLDYEPTERQWQVHDAPEKHKIIAAGARFGKSFLAAHEAIAALFEPGAKGWLVVPEHSLGDEIFKKIRDTLKLKVPKGFIKRLSDRDRYIVTEIGSELQVKSAANKDSLMGASLDFVIIDECARVGEEEMNMCRLRLMDRRGWFMAISTPHGRNWFYKAYLRGQKIDGEPDDDPEWRSWNFPTWDNPYILASDIEERRRTMPERHFRQDVAGEFLDDEGAVFSRVHELASVAYSKGGPDPVRGRRYAVSWDVGRHQDYSAVLVWDVQHKSAVHLDYFQGAWTEQIKRVKAYATRYGQAEIIMDATGEGDAVAEMLEVENRKERFTRRIFPVKMYNAAIKRDLIEKLAIAMEHGEVSYVNHPRLIRELAEYGYEKSQKSTAIKYGAPRGAHDDTVISLALGWSLVGRIQSTARFVIG